MSRDDLDWLDNVETGDAFPCEAIVWRGRWTFEHGRVMGLLADTTPPFVIVRRYTKKGDKLLDPRGPARERAVLAVPLTSISPLENLA